jgi:hypothetical protein
VQYETRAGPEEMDTWRTDDQDVQIRLHVDIVRLDLGPPAAPVRGLPLGLQVLDDHALVSILDHLQKVALSLLRVGRQDRPRLDSWRGDRSTDWSVPLVLRKRPFRKSIDGSVPLVLESRHSDKRGTLDLLQEVAPGLLGVAWEDRPRLDS